VSFVLKDEARATAERFAIGGDTGAPLRDTLALTIAVLTSAERAYRVIGPSYQGQWESLERSPATFTDEFVVKWLADNSPELKRGIATQRRRRIAARPAGSKLVESARDKRARWVAVTLSPDAPIPIKPDVAEELLDSTVAAEDRIYRHLATDSTDPILLAGQVLGLISARKSCSDSFRRARSRRSECSSRR
jgi:hypothetical protein